MDEAGIGNEAGFHVQASSPYGIDAFKRRLLRLAMPTAAHDTQSGETLETPIALSQQQGSCWLRPWGSPPDE